MIMLTDNAASKVNELISAEGEDGLALRGRPPRGCSGFSYEMYFDTDRAADDITKDFGGVDVVVDPQSAQLLEGQPSTTRTASRTPASRSTTPTPSAPAAAASRSAEPIPAIGPRP